MARLGITTGTTANDGTGDTLLVGAHKINSNFNDIYNYGGNGTELTFVHGVWNSSVYTDTIGVSTTAKVGIGTTAKADYSLYIQGDQYITGNISVGGTVTYEDVTNVDSIGIITARNGIKILAGGINIVGVATATTFKGNLEASTIAGTLQTAAQPNITSLGTLSSLTVSGDITANGNIDGDGSTAITNMASLNATQITGTLQTVAQPNITSLGTLSSLTVSGDIGAGSFTKSGGTSSQFLKADGSVDASTYLTSYTETSTLDNVIVRGGTSSSGINVGLSTVLDNIQVRSGDGTPGRVDYYCEVSNAHYTRLQSAPHSEYSGNVTTILPTKSGDLIVGDTLGSSISQNINTTGIITATTIIKSGGLSSQFLKADGSVDASTYLTSALTDVVNDTTPQLGGNLDLNSKTINGAGDINITGVVTATSFSGDGSNLSNLPSSGISDVVSDTTPQLGGNLDLNSKTINGTGDINITGVATATKFVGDGSLLTGISGSGGVAVQDEGSTLSTQAAILNFVGSGVVASGTGATKTITISGGSGGISNVVEDTTPQLGGNLDLNSNNITGTGDVNISGSVTAQDFNSTSDLTLKTNVETVDRAISTVDKLRGVKFNWKQSGNSSYGVIAQELEKILPDLVSGDDLKTVNYNGIIGVLIEAVKDLHTKTENLESEIEKLKYKL